MNERCDFFVGDDPCSLHAGHDGHCVPNYPEPPERCPACLAEGCGLCSSGLVSRTTWSAWMLAVARWPHIDNDETRIVTARDAATVSGLINGARRRLRR